MYSQNSIVITVTGLYFCTFLHYAYSISTFRGDCHTDYWWTCNV